MSHPYRCSKAKCRKRVTLPHKVEWYIHGKVCPACKNNSLRLDMAHRAESKRNRCQCNGLHFPHRKGSIGCDHATQVLIDFHMNEALEREQSGYYTPELPIFLIKQAS